jgi:hypothetical protein
MFIQFILLNQYSIKAETETKAGIFYIILTIPQHNRDDID